MNKYLPIISTPIYFLEKNLLNKIVKEMVAKKLNKINR